MRLTFQDIIMSRGWADEHAGEDNPMDVFEWKLLSFALKQHQDAAEYHNRQIEKITSEMESVSSKFALSTEEF